MLHRDNIAIELENVNENKMYNQDPEQGILQKMKGIQGQEENNHIQNMGVRFIPSLRRSRQPIHFDIRI